MSKSIVISGQSGVGRSRYGISLGLDALADGREVYHIAEEETMDSLVSLYEKGLSARNITIADQSKLTLAVSEEALKSIFLNANSDPQYIQNNFAGKLLILDILGSRGKCEQLNSLHEAFKSANVDVTVLIQKNREVTSTGLSSTTPTLDFFDRYIILKKGEMSNELVLEDITPGKHSTRTMNVDFATCQFN